MTNAEIQVGEYVRLARNQGINKVISSADDFYVLDKDITDESGFITSILYKNQISEEIINHSLNLIDLIEVGDYVNGHLVVGFNEEVDINGYKYKEIEIESNHLINHRLKLEDIKSIVTKEQMEAMQYGI